MSDLKPITALGADAPRSATFGALAIAENADLALASLALRRGAAKPAPMGVDLPGPGQWTPGAVCAFWTGPDQWMIEAPGRATQDFAAKDFAAKDFAAELRDAAPGCSITEQTDGWTAFEITSSGGPAPLLALLERLIDLDLATLGPGAATRTVLEHLSVFVVRRAEERCAVIGARSSAGSLWRALTETAERREETVE